ncbi:hypothetical protein [Oscillatoria sp. FACHB-1406]|uniref:hypothetical protein n=1 Tax=Oscillatoria sp. FACHB-1406 TaxID=2692846 RepID=UPI0016830EF9|nr:hypothetical protein [Oscillatoria sp. FACHB-1406]MBD2580293.1 hypothetical protein [Oscillatoria sp. FACHB-1406]
MNAFISRLKRIRFGQILGVVVAGCLLLVSTACAGGAQAQPSSGAEGGSLTSTPDVNNPAKAYDVREGTPEKGMNRYSDVDPRQGEAGAAAESKALIDSSKRNLTRSGNVVENVKEATKGTGNITKEAQEAAVESASKLSRETKKLVNEAPDRTAAQAQKVKENIYEAREQAQEAAEKTVD